MRISRGDPNTQNQYDFHGNNSRPRADSSASLSMSFTPPRANTIALHLHLRGARINLLTRCGRTEQRQRNADESHGLRGGGGAVCARADKGKNPHVGRGIQGAAVCLAGQALVQEVCERQRHVFVVLWVCFGEACEGPERARDHTSSGGSGPVADRVGVRHRGRGSFHVPARVLQGHWMQGVVVPAHLCLLRAVAHRGPVPAGAPVLCHRAVPRTAGGQGLHAALQRGESQKLPLLRDAHATSSSCSHRHAP